MLRFARYGLAVAALILSGNLRAQEALNLAYQAHRLQQAQEQFLDTPRQTRVLEDAMRSYEYEMRVLVAILQRDGLKTLEEVDLVGKVLLQSLHIRRYGYGGLFNSRLVVLSEPLIKETVDDKDFLDVLCDVSGPVEKDDLHDATTALISLLPEAEEIYTGTDRTGKETYLPRRLTYYDDPAVAFANVMLPKLRETRGAVSILKTTLPRSYNAGCRVYNHVLGVIQNRAYVLKPGAPTPITQGYDGLTTFTIPDYSKYVRVISLPFMTCGG